jgi:PadR family transcriptional regulator PadR
VRPSTASSRGAVGDPLETLRRAVGSEAGAELSAARDLTEFRRVPPSADGPANTGSADQRRLIKQLKMGTTEIVVLSMLSRGDRYGYEISKEVAELTDGYFDFKQGFLYPTLRRLERSQLIEGYWRSSDSRGPNRKYYRISDVGRAKLDASLRTWDEFVRRLGSVLSNG